MKLSAAIAELSERLVKNGAADAQVHLVAMLTVTFGADQAVVAAMEFVDDLARGGRLQEYAPETVAKAMYAGLLAAGFAPTALTSAVQQLNEAMQTESIFDYLEEVRE